MHQPGNLQSLVVLGVQLVVGQLVVVLVVVDLRQLELVVVDQRQLELVVDQHLLELVVVVVVLLL